MVVGGLSNGGKDNMSDYSRILYKLNELKYCIENNYFNMAFHTSIELSVLLRKEKDKGVNDG